jgi:Protein of unknown function (DUF732)
MKALLSIAAVLAGATALAAPAYADANDQNFLQTIQNETGLEITDGPALIAAAQGLCSELKQGKPYNQVVLDVRKNNEEWDAHDASFFVSTSAQAYCPEVVAN